MTDDFDPAAVPPVDDPLADPAEAELQERLAQAKALLDELRPVTAPGRFLEPDTVEAASLLAAHDPLYLFELTEELRPFKVLRIWQRAIGAARRGVAGAEIAVTEARYEVTPTGGIVWLRDSKDGVVRTPLTNFIATIVGEVERDDGAERTLHFEVEARLAGRRHRFGVAAADFNGMAWATRELGSKAVIQAGFAIRDHARAAVQVLSPEVTRRYVFGHTGWRRIRGRWFYLHSGGAIGAGGLCADIETDLGDLSGFSLPAPPSGEELQRAIEASLAVLDVGSLAITVPVYAAIWRAVLGPADFTVHESGRTGRSRPSSLRWHSSISAPAWTPGIWRAGPAPATAWRCRPSRPRTPCS
jgi:hypothetical protein